VRNGFFKGHGLGNDYLALDPDELDFSLTPANVRRLCDRTTGVGADGLAVLAKTHRADFGCRIFNPDGSEAERSGNGLRVFARWLHATRRTRARRFRIDTRGGVVATELHLDAYGEASRASQQLGRARFEPASLPCTLRGPELVDRPIVAAGHRLRFTGVSVGNPHCVVFASGRRRWSRDDLLTLGPALERHRVFPRRVNVQLARITGPRALDILVWERGVGETAASGTSACAAASAGVRRGLLRSPVRVRAPGGTLTVTVRDDLGIGLEGPVEEVARGRLSDALVRALRR